MDRLKIYTLAFHRNGTHGNGFFVADAKYDGRDIILTFETKEDDDGVEEVIRASVRGVVKDDLTYKLRAEDLHWSLEGIFFLVIKQRGLRFIHDLIDPNTQVATLLKRSKPSNTPTIDKIEVQLPGETSLADNIETEIEQALSGVPLTAGEDFNDFIRLIGKEATKKEKHPLDMSKKEYQEFINTHAGFIDLD